MRSSSRRRRLHRPFPCRPERTTGGVDPKGRRVEMCLNNLAPEVGGFRYSRGFSPRGCPRFAVTPTTKSLLTQPLYGKGRNPPLSKPPELALGDAFSGLNDYDTGVTPGCCSGWNGLTDPFRGVFDFQYRRTTGSDKQLHRGRSSVRHHLHPVARGASKVRA